MARRKAPAIPDEMLDQLLPGARASTAFDHGGLLGQLKKALAERALNAEMDHHLAGEGGTRNSRNGYGRKSVVTDRRLRNQRPAAVLQVRSCSTDFGQVGFEPG